jgi:thioesterase domain-containing protein
MRTISDRISNLSDKKRRALDVLLEGPTTLSTVQSLGRRPNQNQYPLSYEQKQMWFINQFGANSEAYNMAGGLELIGKLDIEVLRSALQTLIDRHEVLRACFCQSGAELIQLVRSRTALTLAQTDLRHLDENARKSTLASVIKASTNRPFNLGTDVLFRSTLLRLRNTEHLLIIILHHIIADAWSISILLAELRAIYDAIILRQQPDLAKLTVSYFDYAYWQEQRLGIERVRLINYWKGTLQGTFTPLELGPSGSSAVGCGASNEFEVPQELQEAMKAMCKSKGVTPFVFFVAVLKLLLYRYSSQRDIAVGTPVAGRHYRELEPVVGNFVNTLVLRTEVPAHCTLDHFIDLVRTTVTEAYAHQELPFQVLVDELRPERHVRRNPFFNVAIRFQQDSPTCAKFKTGLEARFFHFEPTLPKFDLVLVVLQKGYSFRCLFEYDTSRVCAESVQLLVTELRNLMAYLLLRPSLSLDKIPPLGHDRVMSSGQAPCADMVGFVKSGLPTFVILDQKSTARGSAPATAISSDLSEGGSGSRIGNVEPKLLAMWQRLLGCQRPLKRTDQFFDIGGNSLKLLQLINEINEAFELSLIVTDVFEHLTIEEMVTVIERSAPDDTSKGSILNFNGSEDGLLTVFVPALSGSSVCYSELARLLGLQFACFGLSAPGETTEEDCPETVEELAMRYGQNILRRWSQGALVLIGWSFGGLMAFETAKIVAQAGFRSKVVLIDSQSPLRLPPREQNESWILKRFAHHILKSSGESYTPEEAQKFDTLDLDEKRAAITQQMKRLKIVPAAQSEIHVSKRFQLFKTLLEAAYQYCPTKDRTMSLPALICLSGERRVDERLSLASDWQQIIGGETEVRVLPGNHYSILTNPHVQAIARAISKFCSQSAHSSH